MPWKTINLQEVANADHFKPNPEYTWRKAQCAVSSYPSAYRVEGDTFYIDTDKVKLTIDQIKDRLHWGYQWNDM